MIILFFCQETLGCVSGARVSQICLFVPAPVFTGRSSCTQWAAVCSYLWFWMHHSMTWMVLSKYRPADNPRNLTVASYCDLEVFIWRSHRKEKEEKNMKHQADVFFSETVTLNRTLCLKIPINLMTTALRYDPQLFRDWLTVNTVVMNQP